MALDAIRPLTEGLEIVGEYRQGRMPWANGNEVLLNDAVSK
jgi:hypothetical protein